MTDSSESSSLPAIRARVGDDIPDIKDEWYFLDFVTVKVDGTLFRIPRINFDAEVPNFFQQFGDAKVGCIEIPGVSKESFRALLLAMYPFAHTARTYRELLGGLDLATQWGFVETRKEVISLVSRQEDFKSENPVDMALLGKKYRVWDWLAKSYTELIGRRALDFDDLNSSIDELELDWETKARLMHAWSLYHPPNAADESDCENCTNVTDSTRVDAKSSDYSPLYRCMFHLPPADCVGKAFHKERTSMGVEVERFPAGERVALDTDDGAKFPDIQQIGPAVCNDTNGEPTYIASAFIDGNVIPCKANRTLNNFVHVPDGEGSEAIHEGHFDILVYEPKSMEWVRTSHGDIPSGRCPVQGGYEEHSEGRRPFYHALAIVNETEVPGRTGRHLDGAKVLWGWDEHTITEDYQILCWK